MGAIIQARRGTAAQWTATDPVLADGEFGYEKDTQKLKIGDGVTIWSLLPYSYHFLVIGDASETLKGLVEAANDVEMAARTDVGATGALLFVRPSKLSSYRDMSETTAGLAGSTLTCDCQNKTESRHKYATITSNVTVVFSNKSNSQMHSLVVALTGSSITFTFESDTRMARYNESGTVWNQSTKVLTVSSIAAGDLHEFNLLKTGSIYILRYDGPVRP